NGHFDRAKDQFEAAANLARDRKGFEDLYREARNAFKLAELTGSVREDADRLFRAARPLRFRLIGLCGTLSTTTDELLRVLKPFYVLQHVDWTSRPELT